jgi:hypothetical protein
LSVDDSLAGKKARCPRCQAVLGVPSRNTPEPPDVARKATKPPPLPDEEPILGIVLGQPGKTPSEEEPILGIVLDQGKPARNAPRDEKPIRGVVRDDRRPASRSRRSAPAPAPIWAWVVGGVTAACLVLGLTITLIVMLSDAGDGEPGVVRKDKWAGAEKGPVWDKKDLIWDKKEPIWDKKDRFEDKKGWPGDDKKALDKFIDKQPPFRPVEPIPVKLADGKFRYAGRILPTDRTTPNQLGKIFLVRLQGQRTYVIDLVSNQFDSYLWLQDRFGQQLAFDDDSGGNLNARIQYKVTTTGFYKIIASSLGGGGQGDFTLSIQEQEGEKVPFVKLPDLELPKSTSPKQALANKPVFVADNQVTIISLPLAALAGDLCWSRDGKAFFAQQHDGVLRRIGLSGFVEEKRLETGRRCSCLAMSGEGLIVTLSELEEAWVIDPDSLEVKKRVPAPKANRVISAPALKIAVAVGNEQRFDPRNRGGLIVLDLEKGEPVAQFQLPARFATISPDGKFLFSQGGIEQLQRVRIEGMRLIEDQASPRIAQNGQGIFVSPDSKYVCLPSGGGNYSIPNAPASSYSTYVFAVDDLKQPAFTVHSGAYPQVVGFDPKGGHVFAQDFKTALMLFSYTGQKKKEIALPIGGREARQYLAHPDGGKLLVRSDKQVFFVDLSGRKSTEAIPDPKVVPEGRIQLKDGMAHIEGRLAMADKKQFGKMGKEFTLEMNSKNAYTFNLHSKDFEPFLIVIDQKGKPVLIQDNGGGGMPADVTCYPTASGAYTVFATSRDGKVRDQGAFTLSIQEKLSPFGKKIEPPLPRDIAGKAEVQDGLSVRPLMSGKARLLASWDRQGKYLFVYDQAGSNLSRIRAADFFREASAKHALLNSNHLAMSISAEGPVLTDGRRILLIDPQTLALKKLFQPPSPTQVVTAAGASFAVGILPASKPRRDVLLDLKGFTETALPGLPAGLITNFAGKSLTTDGKTFFFVPSAAPVLQRYRLKDATLELAEETKIPVRYPMAIAQRRDGKYVAPYSRSGLAQEIGVFESERLDKPAFTLPGTTKALCFLEPGGHILAYSGELQLFSQTGAKIKSLRWPRAAILSLIPHPTRPAALALTVQGAYYLELTELKIAELP